MPEAARTPAWEPLARPRGGGELRVGTSGWAYKGWAGGFFPPGVPARDHLRWYAERFPSVEVNNTFYRLPTEKALASWADAVPDGFLFAIKGSRFVTHQKKLLDAEEHVPKLTRRLPALRDRIGPVLWQLPPGWYYNGERLRAFLRALPDGYRWALELREPSWWNEETYAALRDRGVALVLHDFPGMPRVEEVTADHVYVRFHGLPGDLYGGRYTGRRLAPWAARAREWRRRGLDVFAYFNNDRDVGAPDDAAWLLERAVD